MSALRALAVVALTSLFAGAGAQLTHGAFLAATVNSGSSFAAAGSFCDAETQTLTATADAYVNGAVLSQGSNFGTAAQLHVRSESLANRRTLVRFTLPPVPSYCSVADARLRLNASSAASGRTLQAFRAASAWTETNVTWSNQPGAAGAAATTESGTGWREWDVTEHVQAMYAGSNDGFVIQDASEGALLAASQVFASREADSLHPTLVVTFE